MSNWKSKVHPDLRGECFASLFDVIEPTMQGNIGKLCRFNSPSCLIERELFRIGGVQKIYDGSLAYRVYFSGDTFGRPARPSDINII